MGGKLHFIYVMFIICYVYLSFLSVKGTLNRIILNLWYVINRPFFSMNAQLD